MQSLMLSSSSITSEGGDRSISKGLRLRDQPMSFSELAWHSITSSTVMDLMVLRRRRRSLSGLGISVTARRATSDGEMESGERLESRIFMRDEVCRFWGCATGRLPVTVGILTGLVGVVGRVVKLVVVVGGLEGERHIVSRLSLRLPIMASETGGRLGKGTGVTVMVMLSFLPSSYLGDQRTGENVGDVVIAAVVSLSRVRRE